MEIDEPLSPGGRLFVQPATHQIINSVFGLEQSITLDALRTVISSSLLIKHPRFSSLLVTDNHGREHWRKTEIDINRHIIIRSNPVGEGDNDEEVVNEYLADLTVSSPLTTDKPLWEVHLLSAHKCLVLRIHHALGDGISLVSLMLTLCRKLDDPEQTPTIGPLTSSTQKHKNSGTLESILKLVKMVWFTLVYVFEFMMRGAWVKDRKTAVRGGEGVELWPRKLVTAKFSFEDMKTVKSAVANAVTFKFLLHFPFTLRTDVCGPHNSRSSN
ncbi:putative O-acyltransferase, WSD1, chloramphenicol acetyltransferase-like domain superfamily [Helianthus annuus]|nr:putative O-acyltransferase, WSD1, chloramphenicol acetyltransferase-like domain superfamily [Helianthus annuus]